MKDKGDVFQRGDKNVVQAADPKSPVKSGADATVEMLFCFSCWSSTAALFCNATQWGKAAACAIQNATHTNAEDDSSSRKNVNN